MKRSKGFTLVELLVVVAIIALLVTILMPTLGRAMELARRSICGANANSIGKQILIYSTEHEAFPLLYTWGDSSQTITNSMHSNDIWDKPKLGTNGMQSMWLLIKAGASEKVFECPSDGDYRERSKVVTTNLLKYGWVHRTNYSYGLHRPYHKEENAASTDNTKFNKTPLTEEPSQGSFVILTDKNGKIAGAGNGGSRPGRIHWSSDTNCNKPTNHKDDGFNCLSFQGSVKFHKAKMGTVDANSEAGANNDDVFCTYADTNVPCQDLMPKNEFDTFIDPWIK